MTARGSAVPHHLRCVRHSTDLCLCLGSEFLLQPLSPFLTARTVNSPNILRKVRRTIIRFLIEFRRFFFAEHGSNSSTNYTSFLNRLIMRCNVRPKLAAEAQQTVRSKCRLKSSEVKLIYLIIPHRAIQPTTISFWVPEFSQVKKKKKKKKKKNPSEASEEVSKTVIHSE